MTSDTVSDALGWVSQGFYVFPVNTTNKRPIIENGHLSASNDPEQVAVWFSVDYPKAGIAYNTGKSGVVVADVDRKNSKDGFASLDAEWLTLDETFTYPTPSGGAHYVYEAPEGVRLSGTRDYRGLIGLDRRGGSSYAVAHGAPPTSRSELKPAPQWLCDEARDANGEGFPGNYLEWLDSLPEGEPTPFVQRIIDELPVENFGHEDVTRITYRLVKLASEGHTGVDYAINEIAARWIKPPYDTAEKRAEFWNAVYGAVNKVGALPKLPDYTQSLASLPEAFDVQRFLFGAPSADTKAANAHVFAALRELARLQVPRETIASLVYGAPRLATARGWGIEYVYESIDAAIANAADNANDGTTLKTLEYATVDSDRPSFITEEERASIADETTFIDEYLALAGSRVKMLNEPYHRMQAWTLLSMSYAFKVFIPEAEGSMGVGLFCLGLGPSSSGKTRALKIRDGVLSSMFADDPGFDLGADPSKEALHDTLLQRDRHVSFFNDDEAATFFSSVSQSQSYLSGMIEYLTNLYEGRVKPMLRRGKKAEENAQTALVQFNFAMMGTPERVTELWTQDMYYSGFLPRFIFFLSDPVIESDEQHSPSQAERTRGNAEVDPALIDLGLKLRAILDGPGNPYAMYASQAALHRMAKASKQIKTFLHKRPNWDMLEPVWKRMAGEHMRKAATLIAAWDNSPTVELKHVLLALPHVEEWTLNAALVSEQVTASRFQRDTDAIYSWLVSQGGVVPKYAMARRWKQYEPRDYLARISSLTEQNKIKEVGNTWVAQ